MKDCISIIVPVYNVEKYLRRCVDSLVTQTYENLEILLIDDGSRDGSLSICREYEKIDSRVRVFHKENEGLGLTRNYGTARAVGDYITFVDSDDYLVPDAMEVLIKKAWETQADIISANMYYKDKPMDVFLPERLYDSDEIQRILMVRMMGNSPNILDGFSYTSTAKLFKRELFAEKKLLFPSERELIWEDLAFSVNAFPVCGAIYITHYPIYYYCFNEGSLTHSYKPHKLDLIMILYRYMTDKIQELELPDEARQRLDNNFIGHIRTCIKLEVYYAGQNGFRKALANIGDTCRRKDVQRLIRSYPKQSFNRAQRIYNFFMENRLAAGVYLLTWMQNRKKRIE